MAPRLFEQLTALPGRDVIEMQIDPPLLRPCVQGKRLRARSDEPGVVRGIELQDPAALRWPERREDLSSHAKRRMAAMVLLLRVR